MIFRYLDRVNLLKHRLYVMQLHEHSSSLMRISEKHSRVQDFSLVTHVKWNERNQVFIRLVKQVLGLNVNMVLVPRSFYLLSLP